MFKKMNLKRRSRNRRLKEPFTKRHASRAVSFLKAFGLAFIVFAVLFSGWYTVDELMRSPYLKVRSINVTGEKRVKKEEVLSLSGVYIGENILRVKKKQAEGSIRTHPFVEDAFLRKKLPDEVIIEIKEREPAAIVKLNGLFVMDRGGVLFKKYSPADALDLPVVTVADDYGWEPEVKSRIISFMEFLRGKERFNLDNVSEIHVDRVYGFSVTTMEEGIRLEFGKGDFEKKFSNLAKVVSARGESLEGIEAIDLDNARGVIVKFKTPVIREGGAI